MDYIMQGFGEAFQLLLSLDKEIYGIILLTLYVTIMSTCIAAIIAVPLGILIGLKNFRFKRTLIRLLYTFMSMPPVIAGLFVFLVLSRRGPLGQLELLFTPTAMIIAQVFLVTPIIMGITYNSTREKGQKIRQLAYTMGANRIQSLSLLLFELRADILAAVVSGFGRAISEVGAVMLVGGNIKGHTRVMTTSIAMLQSMGDYSQAIAIGVVLLALSFAINSILYHGQRVI
ncbi:MAG: carbohydrate transporter ATP-binding protein family [Clostridia bacterium]|jgi:tungstate transport system permease protein|nr:carbohydrate transporter ATP-binding protein family [Clostridia bacterium]